MKIDVIAIVHYPNYAYSSYLGSLLIFIFFSLCLLCSDNETSISTTYYYHRSQFATQGILKYNKSYNYTDTTISIGITPTTFFMSLQALPSLRNRQISILERMLHLNKDGAADLTLASKSEEIIWKVLVLDQKSRNILSSVLRVNA